MLKYVKNISSCPRVGVTYFSTNIWTTAVPSEGMEKRKALSTNFYNCDCTVLARLLGLREIAAKENDK